MRILTTMSNRTVGIIGGGLMGVGIAVKFAAAGYEAALLEVSPERRSAIPTLIGAILGEMQEAGGIDATAAAATVGRIRLTTELADLAAKPLVIEAIPEILEAKRDLYRKLEALVAPDTVIASNTSGLMPDVLGADLTHPERFLITHFWNPPHALPLVEVVPGPATRADLIDLTVAMLREIGAEPVVLRKAVPGFLGNRIQFAVVREALHLLQAGVADAETIDTVVKASLGRRYGMVGPLEAADLGGLETFLRVATHLLPDLASDGRELAVLQERVARGETGVAAGVGFYQWTPERRAAIRQKRIALQRKSRPAD